jgi:hypothetical protein
MVTHDPRAAATAEEVLMLRDGALAGRLELGATSSTRASAGADGEDRTQVVLRWLQALDRPDGGASHNKRPARPRAR